MPHIPYPSEKEIPAESKAILEEFESTYGRQSHIFRVMSLHPAFLSTAWSGTKNLIANARNLERWVTEAIVVITASVQKTPYCWQGHSHSLRREGLTQQQVNGIQNQDFSSYSDPERSIFEFAHKAAMAPKMLTQEDYDRLRNNGMSYETILEVLSVVWLITAMNTIVDALNVERTSDQMQELVT